MGNLPMTLPLALTHWLQQQGFDSTDLNSCIDNSMTPLMVAAKEGNSTIVDALLAAGADVNTLMQMVMLHYGLPVLARLRRLLPA